MARHENHHPETEPAVSSARRSVCRARPRADGTARATSRCFGRGDQHLAPRSSARQVRRSFCTTSARGAAVVAHDREAAHPARPRCRGRCSRAAGRGGAGRGRRWRSGGPSPGPCPSARTICWANPYQLVGVWLVRWMTPLRRSSPTRRSIGARSAVKVGWPTWSSTNDSVSCLGGQPHDRLHHVRPVLAAHPRRAHDRRPRAEHGGLSLADQLREAVHAGRVRLVPLVVRPRPASRRTRSRC